MDLELKNLVDQFKSTIELTRNTDVAVKDLVANAVRKGDLEAVTKAIAQAEADLKALPKTLDTKLSEYRRTAYDNNNRYRGVFASEAEAKCVGLQILAKFGSGESKAQMSDALKLEFPDVHARAMADGVDADGGALVMPEYSNRVLRLVEDYGVFDQNAFHMPMSSNELTFIRQTGEVTVYLVGENTAGTDSKPQFKNIKLTAKEWGILNFYPVTLGEDAAVPLAELLARSSAYAIAKQSDLCGFKGDGSSTYFEIKGVIPSLGSAGNVTGSGNSWSAITLDDLLKTQGTLPQYASMRAKWYAHRAFFFGVMFKLAIKQSLVTVEVINGKPSILFYGTPVEITQSLPNATASGQVSALYGDLSLAATVGDRRQVRIEQSREYKFAERQITTLTTVRKAINVHDAGDSSNHGPIVGLATT